MKLKRYISVVLLFLLAVAGGIDLAVQHNCACHISHEKGCCQTAEHHHCDECGSHGDNSKGHPCSKDFSIEDFILVSNSRANDSEDDFSLIISDIATFIIPQNSGIEIVAQIQKEHFKQENYHIDSQYINTYRPLRAPPALV